MRVHKIWAANVRGISAIKSIEPALGGVTMIHAPNETGKTTLSEVLTFLFTYPSNSNDSSIKKLQPIGKDVGPSMGATIEIGPDIYEITKQWLKEKKTEVKITGSRNLQLAGPDAQREIEKLFTDSLDGTFWELLQVKQAEFNTLVGRDFTDDFLDDLQNLLDKISTDSDEENADTLFEKVETEYSKWFTANGRATTAAGSQGRVLSDLETELRDLKETEIELRGKIAENVKVEEALGKDQVDVEFLKRAYKAQQLNKEIVPLRTKVTEYTRIANEIDSAFEASPLLKGFSIEKFANLQKLYPLELKFSALNLLTLKAIEANKIEIQGEKVDFLKGEIREVPLEPGLQIVIPGLLEISYGDAGEGSPNLALAHQEYEALLTEMGLDNWTSAEKLSREYGDLNSKIKHLETLENQKALASLQEELATLQSQMTQFPDWDALITSPTVNFEELDSLRDNNAELRGQWIQINKNGWDHKLNEALSHIQSIDSQLKRLKLQRDAIK